MGGSSSKPLELPKDVPRKYGKLLLEPAVVKKFDALTELVKKNNDNDLHFLTQVITKIHAEQAPLMQKVAGLYESMLQDVIRVRGMDRDQAYGYLADNKNMQDFFLRMSGGTEGRISDEDYIKGPSGSPSGGPIRLDVDRFIDNLRARDAKTRYYQFKFMQATLFQAAFAHAMWEIAKVFVDSTAAFHKSRENVFHSVMKQMFGIINKYTGGDALTVKDMDDIETIRQQMEETQQMLEVRKLLDQQKTLKLQTVLESMAKIDPEGFGADYGKLVPTVTGAKSPSASSSAATERFLRDQASTSTVVDSTAEIRRKLATKDLPEKEMRELLQELNYRTNPKPVRQQQPQQQPVIYKPPKVYGYAPPPTYYAAPPSSYQS